MNFAGKYNSGLLFANFNQDFTCISVGTPEGYKIFSCDPFVHCFAQNDGGIGIVEMLFTTSLVAVVGAGDHPARSPRRLQIINTKTKSTICELNFVTAILNVKLNKKRIVVVMETKIHIYDVNTMKILHTIDTVPNPKGMCAFSSSNKNCYLAYPASQNAGDIYIFDALSLHTVNVIQAHKAPVAALSINQDGTLLATASEKGTVIRVYSIPVASKAWTFRRGTYPAVIYSLAFSVDTQLLGVVSDTGTVHIYKLDRQQASAEPSLVSAYLPEVLSQVWEPQRDWVHLRLPTAGVPAMCAIVPREQGGYLVYVLTGDGFYYAYPLDSSTSGEIKLAKEFSLLMDAQTDEVSAKYL